MDWVMDELLHPKGSLPVFGKVENVIQTLDKKLFGDLQVFIINYFSLSTTMAGGSFFINHVFDIKAIGVARELRLTGNQVQVVSIEIPRRLVELVQDDVFSRLGSLWIPSSKTVKGG
ncbi:hypothetical protein H4Q26_007911 [Puccinia striiformis f. sp. tritici PST-130]|nr:hypothetical protein H4Q26_007902 [Puccinia striiformis f. sp. tritici PST-130]KAI9612752.1 hypothetical protein H4Q26_007911 [Puccinia striiformis f. sp. tritici PST-130]